MASPLMANFVVTASPIVTVINLNGSWASGGITGPFISIIGNAISVDMSAYQRPFAAGSVLDNSNIRVTFGDDNTYTAKLVPGTTPLSDEIVWSNGSVWTRTLHPFTSLVDLNGHWVRTGTSTPVMNLSVAGKFISIDMPAPRPRARGYVLDFADIFVDFPDDTAYTGRLVLPNQIQWSNNSIWQKVPLTPSIHLQWELVGLQKVLSVSGSGFTSGVVTIRVTGEGGRGSLIAQFTGVATSTGTFTANHAISCTSGGVLAVSVAESDPAAPVITTTTICK
jgi:hypothetical protein